MDHPQRRRRPYKPLAHTRRGHAEFDGWKELADSSLELHPDDRRQIGDDQRLVPQVDTGQDGVGPGRRAGPEGPGAVELARPAGGLAGRLTGDVTCYYDRNPSTAVARPAVRGVPQAEGNR